MNLRRGEWRRGETRDPIERLVTRGEGPEYERKASSKRHELIRCHLDPFTRAWSPNTDRL